MADQRDPYDFGPPPARRPGATSGYGSGGFGDAPPEHTLAAPLRDEFGRMDHGPALTDPYVVVRTPVVWLAAAIGLGLAGAVVAWFFGDAIGPALAAWVLAGPLAIGLLAVHSLRDTALRTRLGYDRRPSATGLYTAAIVVAAVGIGLSAWRIAEWAGRL